MTPEHLVDQLAGVRLPHVFNPYADTDICAIHDAPDAPSIRRANLVACLKSWQKVKVEEVWIGLEPGYLGARRTGIPFTDEMHLTDFDRMIGANLGLRKATKTPAASEDTATCVWEVIELLARPIAFWNVFPLHSYEPSSALSNRRHGATEREFGLRYLEALVEILQPKRLVSVSTDKRRGLAGVLGMKKYHGDFRQIRQLLAGVVRHPSHGGQDRFKHEMMSIDRN